MPKKTRYQVRLGEVVITRQGETATITYKEKGVPVTNLTIGPAIANMTDADIVELFNDTLRAQEELAARHPHVVFEVPLDAPQMEYCPRSRQWAPRGDVLRCEIGDGGPDGEATVTIDEHELTLEEFGRMLLVHAGWGMRIEFVDLDRVHRRPTLEVREPERK